MNGNVTMTRGQATAPVVWWCLVVFVAILSLVPRVADLDDFLTTDEAYHWIDRTTRFADALVDGRWADTVQTGHPGVTIMWAGSMSRWIGTWSGRGATTPADDRTTLATLRLVPALLQVLAIVLAMWWIRPLTSMAIAFGGAVFWALAPYLIAHGRLLHLDAMLTATVTLSVIALLRATAPAATRPRHWLLAAGALGGLALLTKGPALVLLPFTALVLLLTHAGAARGAPLVQRWRTAAHTAIGAGAWWAVAAVSAVVVLWPALWVDPARALGAYVDEILVNGGRPNGDGQFFWGQAVADPGWLFYPVADLFRMTPLMLIGVLAAPRAIRRGPGTRALLILAALVVFWTVVMTLGPKKFDRYVLPTWPALALLAGAGWAGILGALWRQRRRVAPLVVAGLIAIEAAQPFVVHPYTLSYYNPLLGGGVAAQRMLLIGWGEGLDQAGAYLRSRPDIGGGPVLSALPPALQPFVPVTVRPITDQPRVVANYAVVYLESVQRADEPAIYAVIGSTVPLHRVVINGIEYARIHQLPRPFDHPVDATFAGALRLAGVSIQARPATVLVTPAWDVRAALAGDLAMFIHVFDPAGRRIAQVDIPPGGPEAPPTSAWQAGQQIAVPLPIALPPDAPSGTYRLALGMVRADGTRVPFTGGTPVAVSLAGERALLLGTFELP